MFAHRLLTLGHIVATTKIPWKKALGLGKKKQFNADKMLAKRGIEIMKEWQASYQVSLLSILTYQKSIFTSKNFYTTLSIFKSMSINYFSLKDQNGTLPWRVL